MRTTLFVEAPEGTGLQLFDNLGRNVTPKITYINNYIELDVKGLASGIYIMQLQTEREQALQFKVLVQK